MHYLDHNASTPLDERVLAAMYPYLQTLYGNPSSLYRLGRIAKTAIDIAREQVAALVGVQAEQIIFTSGGTESNALALANAPVGKAVAVSKIEHPSVIENARLNRAGAAELLELEVDAQGLLQFASLQAIKPQQLGLVSVMLANNETGVIQNIAAISDYCRTHQIALHCDAVQAAGKIPVDFATLGVQMLSLSSHKIYGPKGCGALVIEKNFRLRPLQVGGEQEQGLRAGTENVAAIVGFGQAAAFAKSELTARQQHITSLRCRLEHGLLAIPSVVIFSHAAQRLPNTVQFGIEGMDGQMLVMQLDQKNIAASSGSACASGDERASPVLAAMGIAPSLAKSAVRLSLGKDNTPADIDYFLHTLNALLTAHSRF